MPFLARRGNIKQPVATEAVQRGHDVTAAIRLPYKMPRLGPGLTIVETEVVDAWTPRASRPPSTATTPSSARSEDLGTITRPRIVIESGSAIVQAMRTTGVSRLLIAGVSNTLRTTSGVEVMNQPDTGVAEQACLYFQDAWHAQASGAVPFSDVPVDFFERPPRSRPSTARDPSDGRIGHARLHVDQISGSLPPCCCAPWSTCARSR